MIKSNLKSYFKSYRFRIFILILIFGILPGILIRQGLLYSYEQHDVDIRIASVSSQAKLISANIVAKDYLSNPTDQAISAQLNQMSNIYDGRIMLIDDAFHVVKDTYRMDERKHMVAEEVMIAFEGEMVLSFDNERSYIEIAIPIMDSEGANVLGIMLISMSMDMIRSNLEYISIWSGLILLVIIVALTIVGFFATSKLISPLNTLAKHIKQVKEGHTDEFQPVNTYTETSMISEACDDMLGRMKVLDDSRQEFVSNVSHELKTPLTSMKILADSLVGQENVPVELYKEFMQDIAHEINRENSIIDDLLELVKMDKSEGEMHISSHSINEIIELLMKRLSVIAEDGKIELIVESNRSVIAEVDEVKLTLALSNIIENAIKYNRPEGHVIVSLDADHENFYVAIKDNGYGIPEESIPHIFERFYRVDKSRSREIGGTGLGLAIARSIVVMHKGIIQVESTDDEGTVFTVSIPLKYIP